MEPVLTCLDEITYLTHFSARDITIGTIIAFASPSCQGGRGLLHRVMDIKVEGGIYYYWPKGDNNQEAHGCWVPHTDVKGYVVAIHQNARLANAELRTQVNQARQSLLSAWELYDCWYANAIDSERPGHIPYRC